MRKALAIWTMGLLCLAAVAFAQNPKSQGTAQIQSIKGTVLQADASQKMFVVRDDSGNSRSVYWDSSTELKGGEPKEGQSVELSAVDRDGKLMATSVQVVAAKTRR